MKTIFITSFHPFISRNILATDVLNALSESGNVRVIVFILNYKKDYFEENFSLPRVSIENVIMPWPSMNRWTLLWKRVAKFAHHTASARIERKLKWRREGKFFYWLGMSLLEPILRLYPARALLRFLDFHTAYAGRWDAYFQKYKPDLVFVADILNERDVELVQESKRNRVPVYGMVRSWDNLTLHGIVRALPDHLITATSRLRDDAVRFHDFKENNITVVGIPHYDKYFRGPKISREAFLNKIGFDPNKKMIMHAIIGDQYIPNNDTDPYVLQVLSKRHEQVYIRFAPTIPIAKLEGKAPYPNMYWDKPGVKFKDDVESDKEISPEDDDNLMHAIYYSDVVSCGPSSIALDGVFFDKPVVIAGFHPRKRGYYDYTHRWDYNHYAHPIEIGAVRLAKTKEEYLSAIDEYMKNPEHDRQARKEFREACCGIMDGNSGKRLAQFLFDTINK
ncbi:MAG: CDP-glycerol glycerophosphotransferase family protein [Candidatus Niyogibacteria bacterium]|nr:CDP-glycerol glycerophosphotransferase family protein [Candidatus Niyogibacteria bacterium]